MAMAGLFFFTEGEVILQEKGLSARLHGGIISARVGRCHKENLMKFPQVCSVAIVALGWGMLCVAEESTLEMVHFTAPAGWQVTEPPGQSVKIYASPDSDAKKQAGILIGLRPPKDPLDFRAEFDAVVKQTINQGKAVESSQVAPGKTRQGYESLTQTVVSQQPDGQKLHLRFVGAKVDNRLVSFVYFGTNSQIYEKHQREMNDLLASASFVAGAGAAGGARAEMEALEAEKQKLLRRLAEIEARQKQLGAAPMTGGGMFGTGGAMAGAAAGGATEEERIKAAQQKFTAEVDRRRKPNVVLGDILMLDGKPIPNVATYTVSVKGVTSGGEGVRYDFDVDANGHFEQQVAEGAYRVFVAVTVNHDGHRLPLDVVSIDGKGTATVASSSEGIVKDFRLVMDSRNPQEDAKSVTAFYGGVLGVSDHTFGDTNKYIWQRHPGAMIRLTFEPKGPQVDGQQRATFTVDTDPRQMLIQQNVQRIALGTYKVSAAFVERDGKPGAPLQCSLKPSNGFAQSVELFWDNGDYSGSIIRSTPVLFLKD
jgi:hypothetical protein